MNIFNKNIIILILLTVLSGMSGCGKDPVREEQVSYAKLSVTVVDELGEPLEGIKIVTFPDTYSIFTDKNGHAIFEQVETGQYQVVASRADIPIFYKETYLRKFKEVEMVFVVATKVTINVLVKDITGRPLTDTLVSTSPNTSKETTDESGYVTFKNVPIRDYTFIVHRNNAVAYVRNKSLAIIDGKIKDIEIIIVNEKPLVNILEPQNHDFQNIFDVHFSGEGFDFEDGEIPGENLSWYSSIDGELGTGNEITVDALSVGKHTITLSGIDADGNITQRFINLNLFYYEEESYFPIPYDGSWKYRHQNPEFTIINSDGAEEIWTLKDVEVRMKSVDSRYSTMRYSVQTVGRMKYCEYIIEDFFETDPIIEDSFKTDPDNIYVTKTTERFKIWDNGSTEFTPKSKMDIEMRYTPSMILMKKHVDPLSQSSFESNISVDVTWMFDRDFLDSRNFTETIEIVNTVDIGGTETVETDLGAYEAAVITVRQGETERKWWLAKGIGIVRFDYNTLNTPVTALLYDTNLLSFSQDNPLQKNISHANNYSGNMIRKTLKSPPDSPEETREIINFLRTLTPR